MKRGPEHLPPCISCTPPLGALGFGQILTGWPHRCMRVIAAQASRQGFSSPTAVMRCLPPRETHDRSAHPAAPDTWDMPGFLRPAVRTACAQAARRHPAVLSRTGTRAGDTPHTNPCRTATALSISAMPAPPPWIAGPPEASQFGTVPPPHVIPGATVLHPPPTVLYAIRTCDPAFGRRHRIRLPRAWTEA